MKDHRKIIKIAEIFLIVFIWLVLLLTPVVFREENDKTIWQSMVKQLEILIPLSLLVAINRLYLIPRILFKGQPFRYLVYVLGIILLITVSSYLYDFGVNQQRPEVKMDKPQRRLPPRDISGRGDFQNDLPPEQPGRSGPIPSFANFLILSVLIVASDTGLRSTLRWTKAIQEKTELEKENVANQLLLLQNQLSPHFFMNTLNNIHSMVDINSEQAKSAIIRLSKMMRYLLYETESRETTLSKEIDFIESYIFLMKIRFNEKVKITFNYPSTPPIKPIPPLLFIPFIENVFKHGISYKQASWVELDILAGNERILYALKSNSTGNGQTGADNQTEIETIRKRLDLLYGKNYHLEIIKSEDINSVNLSIPI